MTEEGTLAVILQPRIIDQELLGMIKSDRNEAKVHIYVFVHIYTYLLLLCLNILCYQ